MLNVVDDVTRECLAAIPDTSISGRRVARELTALIDRRGKPGMIVSDRRGSENDPGDRFPEEGAELTSNVILKWCAGHKVEWPSPLGSNQWRLKGSASHPASRCRMGSWKASTTGCGTRS